MPEAAEPDARVVRHLRQILVWPLQLMPLREDAQIQNHWELLEQPAPDNPWHAVADEFTDDPDAFQERHYSEFVTFLPYVQRMLYGEGKGRATTPGESPIRLFRRSDVAALRVTAAGDGALLTLKVAHIDLYFFYDLDIVLLVVEVSADDLGYARAHEVLYSLGRSYPTYWTPDGLGGHCPRRVECLDAEGRVLAASDFGNRGKYLSYVCRFRSPCIASHWEFLLDPLVLHHSDRKGAIRYRLVEYHRMPLCAFLSLDDPRTLTRADFVRLAFVTPPGPSDQLPFGERELYEFEFRHCLDRYWSPQSTGRAGTRVLCSGEAFVMVTGATDSSFIAGGPSLLEQFRHQYFLVFLIAHLHKAALFMLSDRLLQALNRLDIQDAETVRRFKRDIRALKEIFLRFTHRYWFHEVSDQVLAKGLYRQCCEHLGTERLYAELRDEIEEMNRYLDSDSLRRQANTVLRLTVVTIFGLIGTVATGFLGMNLFDHTEETALRRLLYFAIVFVPTMTLTLYTIVKSKRLSDFLDALSDERLPARAKLRAFLAIWSERRRQA
ncbi:hypothetical protein AAG565_08615 [Fontimonas sp. SYSU GA230001]|uniref:hypothetical protein n=1 Tax=Fontimonas sp. SYSU GA230001 TaxID=3142450 RepID=UPI0032B4B633